VTVIDDRQQHLTAEWDTAMPDRACRGTKAERDYTGGALISLWECWWCPWLLPNMMSFPTFFTSTFLRSLLGKN